MDTSRNLDAELISGSAGSGCCINSLLGAFSIAGIDMQFLRVGLEMATECVYSLHKTATREVVHNSLL